jgi:thiamine-phosphate pyrophosphorylase
VSAVRERLAAASLYCIADLGYIHPADCVRVCGELIAGGAGIVQLRAKGCEESLVRDLAWSLAGLCRGAGVPFVVNDFPEIAAEVGADGVHLGQDDGDIAAARRVLGPASLIGRSTHSLGQARRALEDGFDYIGFGPLHVTPTKPGRAAIGLEDIAEMEETVGAFIPAFCIGGIGRGNLPEVLARGARRVVMVSDLLGSASVRDAVREACGLLNGGRPG